MSATAWRCDHCRKLYVQLPNGHRGSRGHLLTICARCSLDMADEALESVPPVVQWLVARLRREVTEAYKARDDDARYYERNAREC